MLEPSRPSELLDLCQPMGASMIKFTSTGCDHDARREKPSGGEFLIGKDKYDHWIVMETGGRCGGFFASREQALRYARHESNGHTESVRSVTHLLTFSLLDPKLCSNLTD